MSIDNNHFRAILLGIGGSILTMPLPLTFFKNINDFYITLAVYAVVASILVMARWSMTDESKDCTVGIGTFAVTSLLMLLASFILPAVGVSMDIFFPCSMISAFVLGFIGVMWAVRSSEGSSNEPIPLITY